MTMTRTPALLTLLLALLWLAVPPSGAGAEDDYFRGKTITIVIPIGPGGAYDAYARLISRHLGRQLPGNPTIISRNMPGGGGVIASNYFYNIAPQDGTSLTIITSSFANEQRFANPQIKYDARRFLAVGRLVDTTSVLFFWHASPIKTLQDLLTKPSTVAISSVHEISTYRLQAMNSFAGTSIKVIPGYPSARDYVLASERGETDGGTSTFIGLSQLFSSYLEEKKLNILVQFSVNRDPAMPDTPTVIEIIKDPEVKQIFRQLVSNDEIGRALFTTPNVPPERLALLRSAFGRMIADAEFRADAEQLRLPLAPKAGEDMQRIVNDMFDISPEALAKVRALIK
ncbi:MAG TPA: tripartite tricarboxylate transporter substrate-binding protein [Xanthobacteraceae bacterium]|jgi:tripartite-type tricarboxylate transporter receptor subunit TctC